MSWDIGCSRNIFLSLRDRSKVFHVRIHYELKRYSYTVLEAPKFSQIRKFGHSPKFQNLSGLFTTDYAEQVLYIVQIDNKLPFHNIVGTDISGVF